ncbi:unnamed protein product, partial [Symbiodinium sp. CCMP2456]
MEEEGDLLDGEALTARDCACVGEGFLDPLAPLCVLACGEDEEGLPVTVHCLVAGDVQGKLLICLPAAAWHRKVAKRTVPRGFLSKVIAAEVASASIADRGAEIAGQVVRVWMGFCEGEAERSIQVSDATPSVPFGVLPNGELLVPFVEAVALLWQHQVAGALSTPVQTANEGPDAQASLSARMAQLERTLAALGGPAAAEPRASAGPKQAARSKAGSPAALPPRALSAQPQGHSASGGEAFPGLDQSVVTAALASGVEPHVLGEMSRLVEARPLGRLKAEPARPSATQRRSPLDESEDEGDTAAPLAALEEAAPNVGAGQPQEPAEAFAQAMV